jgi:hypothetical protein
MIINKSLETTAALQVLQSSYEHTPNAFAADIDVAVKLNTALATAKIRKLKYVTDVSVRQ